MNPSHHAAPAALGHRQAPLPFVANDSAVPPPPIADELTGVWDEDTADIDEDAHPDTLSWPFVEKPAWCGSNAPPGAEAAAVTASPATSVPALRPAADVDIAEFARLRAAIDVGRRPLDAILAPAQLDREAWRRVGVIHIHLLERHQRRGERAPLDAFDDAYLAAFEAERGWPIAAEEYAILEIASERGTLHEELAKRQIPPAALFPIKRCWLRRLVADAALARDVQQARQEGGAR